MKQLDKLLIKSFIPPFIASFFVALFVLVMQTLWLYMDDIAGKGVGMLIMVELISYMSVSMFPLALPIAVLLASVMVMGNFGERYELAAMKCAGIPLFRTMAPLMVFTAFVSMFSFYCSNILIPISNLKFKSRLHDITKQKPTLNLEEGVFNDDFKGYAIRIGNKLKDDKGLEDVLLYDHSETNQNRLTVVSAKEGRMFVTEDEKFFVLRLEDGSQYYEMREEGGEKRRSYPYVRIHFDKLEKGFDLTQFDLEQTDEDRFKKHYSMLSVPQLSMAIDSIRREQTDRLDNLEQSERRYLRSFNQDTLFTNSSALVHPAPTKDTLESRMEPMATRKIGNEPIPMVEGADPLKVKHFVELFVPERRREILSRSRDLLERRKEDASQTKRTIDRYRISANKHIFEMWSKFSLSVTCFIFLFIGAPMGSIIRKGGFGYPLLIAVVFFVIFIILHIYGKNVAENETFPPALAAWLGCLVLFPIGIWLTTKAKNDSTLFDLDTYKKFFLSFLKIIPFRKKAY